MEKELKELADLLRAAVSWCKLAETMPERIELDMSVYHVKRDDGICRICMGGCYNLLARGIEEDMTVWSKKDWHYAQMIDNMRTGQIHCALAELTGRHNSDSMKEFMDIFEVKKANSIIKESLKSYCKNGFCERNERASYDRYLVAADVLEGLA